MQQERQGTTEVSFFHRVMAELKKLFQHAPGWEAGAAATVTYIAPMVELVVGILEPASLPICDQLVAKIQSALAAAAVVIKAAGPTPTLVTYLNAIQSDLSQIEEAAGIKDAATASKLNALVSSITAEVNAVLSAIKTGQTV